MNDNIKWHKPTGPAFHAGQEWFSGEHRCTIVKVEKRTAAKDGRRIG
jgi:hypothetical protein